MAFGREILLTSDDDEQAAVQIDQQIIHNYLLQATNHLALEKLREINPDRVPPLDLPIDVAAAGLSIQSVDSKTRFEERLANADSAIRPYLLQMYANPVISRFAAGKADPFATVTDPSRIVE